MAARNALKSLQERLVEGEKIVASARIHWGIFWRAGAVLLLALLATLFVATEIGILLAVVSMVMAVHAALLQEILMLVVTDRRVFARYGILQVDVVDIHFDKIESIELERMPPGFFFGYANVVIMGTGNRYIVIPYVANAIALRKAYNEMTLSDAV